MIARFFPIKIRDGRERGAGDEEEEEVKKKKKVMGAEENEGEQAVVYLSSARAHRS